MAGLPPIDRKAEVMDKLDKELKEVDKRMKKLGADLLNKEREDVCTLYLRGKMMEIEKLTNDIEAFKNVEKHFNPKYRTLEGHCSKLQTDLDRIDVFGRDDLRATRKKAYQDVDTALTLLTTKAHSNGKVCVECPVKN